MVQTSLPPLRDKAVQLLDSKYKKQVLGSRGLKQKGLELVDRSVLAHCAG